MTHHRGYRIASRDVDWGSDSGVTTIEQINCGSLLRIADAVETMAKSYDEMLRDRDYWRERAAKAEGKLDTERRRTAALRGIVNRKKP